MASVRFLKLRDFKYRANCFVSRPRVIRLDKKPFDSLELEVSGGNLLGIYVTELTEESVLKAAGLKIGDRLLKVRRNVVNVKNQISGNECVDICALAMRLSKCVRVCMCVRVNLCILGLHVTSSQNPLK